MIQYPELPEPFPSPYEKFIYVSRYSKWLDKESRRETWAETVARLIDFYNRYCPLKDKDAIDLYTSIYNLEVMPSMRALMSAGPALERCHVAAYNCAYLPVDSLRSFDEACYILMCGTGVGYSVEDDYTRQLPKIAEEFNDTDTVIKVGDSKEGWARSLRELISLLVAGQRAKWDVSGVRPAGARLKTFGGRASGPEPLVDLFKFASRLFEGASGRRLTNLECHDLMCKIADVVVVGGVRRSAMISLSDVTDDRMRKAKTGAWWEAAGFRALANNSAVYPRRKPDIDLFLTEFKSLVESKAGERGFFSRYACQEIAKRSGRRDVKEIILDTDEGQVVLKPFDKVIINGKEGLAYEIQESDDITIL